MTSRRWLGLPALLLAATVGLTASARDRDDAAEERFTAIHAGELSWTQPDLPGFPPGLEVAVVHGDPSAEGSLFVLRLALPDGCRIPPHWHPGAESVTVLQGRIDLAVGADQALARYGPGDFIFIPGRLPHSAVAEGKTVLQVHGIGPFSLCLVDEDDAGKE